MGCITTFDYISASTKQATALITQATIDAAIQVVLALWQRKASNSIAEMQKEIADQQVQLAEEVEAHAELFWPEEAELVADAFGESLRTPSYVPLMAEFSGLAQNSLATGRTDWINRMRAACMDPSRCEDARWQRNSTLITVDLSNYGARQEESRTQIVNDRRYARQYGVLQMGRGQLRDFLSYQAIGGASAASAGSLLINSINSALQAFGYHQTRNDTVGWGSGIRETWTKTYMPQATMPQQQRSYGVNMSDQSPPLAPIARQPVTINQKITKENEWDTLKQDLDVMQRLGPRMQ
jgi:hypothetical protein